MPACVTSYCDHQFFDINCENSTTMQSEESASSKMKPSSKSTAASPLFNVDRNLQHADRIVFATLIKPVVEQLNHINQNDQDKVLDAFEELEHIRPGFSHEFLYSAFSHSEHVPEWKLQESALRHARLTQDFDISNNEEAFQQLNSKARNLKAILSRIPNEIYDRRTFLETIKEIANAIKRLLDGVHAVKTYIPTEAGRVVVDQRKREFVSFSKSFSQTLKEFFKEGVAECVFRSANALVYQTDLIMRCVKLHSE